MKRLQMWLEMMYEDRLRQDLDMIVPVIGDEGTGKSTLMMQLAWLWHGIVGFEQTPETVVGRTAWDLGMFKDMLAESDQYSVIVIHDAARVLSRKKAMHGDQVEVEEDLLDARFGNYLMLLGYQEFDLVPTMLATRRAKQALRIVERGWVHGHKEKSIRRRYDEGEWKEPAMRDSFPDLEGTALWEHFVEEDQRRKRERIANLDEDEEEPMTVEELADQVREDGIEQVVSVHGGHNRRYIDKDLIEIEYGVSGNKAKKAAKLLKKRVRDPELST